MFITCIILTVRPIRTCVFETGGWDQLTNIEKVIFYNNPCNVAIPPTYCFFFPHFFQHRLNFTSASSLFHILSYFHSHFTSLDVLENEYTSCHSTLTCTEDTYVHSSIQPMQWLLFPLTVVAPLTKRGPLSLVRSIEELLE